MIHTRSSVLSTELKAYVTTDICSPLIPDQAGAKLFFTKALGPYLYDADGNEYIDFNNGKGSILLGHNAPLVNQSVLDFLRENRNCQTGPAEYHIQLAKKLSEKVHPGYEIAFYRTGGYAVYSAVLAAQKASGKKILLSAGYHGSWAIWELQKELFTPNKYGMVDFYYILEKLEELLKKYQGEVNAVIISPDDSYFSRDYYKQFFEICSKHEVIVIADEVKAGFRYNNGPYLGGLGFQADIYAFSKCLANGYGLSCVCGRKDLMKSLRKLTYTDYYGGIPYMAALATLDQFDKYSVQEKIKETGNSFIQALKQKIKASKLPLDIYGNGNLFQFHFGDKEMEKDFYKLAIANNIVFYDFDNQCPSAVFDTLLYNKVLGILETILFKLKEQYRHLLGTPISGQRVFETAFNQIDGCLEQMELKDKLTYLPELIKTC